MPLSLIRRTTSRSSTHTPSRGSPTSLGRATGLPAKPESRESFLAAWARCMRSCSSSGDSSSRSYHECAHWKLRSARRSPCAASAPSKSTYAAVSCQPSSRRTVRAAAEASGEPDVDGSRSASSHSRSDDAV